MPGTAQMVPAAVLFVCIMMLSSTAIPLQQAPQALVVEAPPPLPPPAQSSSSNASLQSLPTQNYINMDSMNISLWRRAGGAGAAKAAAPPVASPLLLLKSQYPTSGTLQALCTRGPTDNDVRFLWDDDPDDLELSKYSSNYSQCIFSSDGGQSWQAQKTTSASKKLVGNPPVLFSQDGKSIYRNIPVMYEGVVGANALAVPYSAELKKRGTFFSRTKKVPFFDGKLVGDATLSYFIGFNSNKDVVTINNFKVTSNSKVQGIHLVAVASYSSSPNSIPIMAYASTYNSGSDVRELFVSEDAGESFTTLSDSKMIVLPVQSGGPVPGQAHRGPFETMYITPDGELQLCRGGFLWLISLDPGVDKLLNMALNGLYDSQDFYGGVDAIARVVQTGACVTNSVTSGLKPAVGTQTFTRSLDGSVQITCPQWSAYLYFSGSSGRDWTALSVESLSQGPFVNDTIRGALCSGPLSASADGRIIVLAIHGPLSTPVGNAPQGNAPQGFLYVGVSTASSNPNPILADSYKWARLSAAGRGYWSWITVSLSGAFITAMPLCSQGINGSFSFCIPGNVSNTGEIMQGKWDPSSTPINGFPLINTIIWQRLPAAKLNVCGSDKKSPCCTEQATAERLKLPAFVPCRWASLVTSI